MTQLKIPISTYFIEHTAISESEFSEIEPYFLSKQFKKGEFILHAGAVCNFMLFVESGCIRLFNVTEEGEEFTRYFGIEGKFGTALSSLISGEPAFEFIQALEFTEAKIISKADFYSLVESHPAVNKVYRGILEMAYTTSQRRIYNLQGESALDRLKWLMKYQPGILARLSSKVIASYVGVTPFTLSRLKSEL
ncbi:Crp/Fnr family transcriptional regulator [Algoriphagus hitonicola]|uniref:cAMP-binding domain of CRP or a regulatory subunit of cAMP-dependent protein kinases n=1 Tax=Algoriphagus hitonicola TaxID=435880 RepID=A0A1I2S585_9BACT|nr:Crp/Fnr family transcriptional regulator [Algoriphagus hitonicola]SFG48065.1 cAMP-binding domain of CRP or a regulatory subunit of cAMP-dependent protein kinases [Algoriphagus hitonicola]